MPINRRNERDEAQPDGPARHHDDRPAVSPRVLQFPEAVVHDESLSYVVELWTVSRRTAERVLGQAGSMQLAMAIYQAANEEYPDRLVTLSRGGQRLLQSHDDPPVNA